MKKGLVITAVTLVVGVALSLSVLGSATPKIAEADVDKENSVITVSKNAKNSNVNEILEARFLNMLNHSFVYNSTFDSLEEMVNTSMPELLKYRENEDDSFVAENYVSDYMLNMYGIKNIDFSAINIELPKNDGYVYIIPKGFTEYSHKIVGVTANEDGSFTVETRVTISNHDSDDITEACTSLLVPNSNSAFGYSIIYSNIGGASTAV